MNDELGSSNDDLRLRSDEAVGKEFLGLDIGLPVQRLLPPLKQALSGPYDEHSAVVLEAVNRRGRRVRRRITLSPLLDGGEQGSDAAESPEVVGVIPVMDEIGAAIGGADQGSELSRTVSLP